MAIKNTPQPLSVKQKISQSMTGRKQTPEHIRNNAQARIGKTRSEETKRKMSEATKRRYAEG